MKLFDIYYGFRITSHFLFESIKFLLPLQLLNYLTSLKPRRNVVKNFSYLQCHIKQFDTRRNIRITRVFLYEIPFAIFLT